MIIPISFIMWDQRDREQNIERKRERTQMYLKKTISEFFFNTYLQNGPFDS
jgi:hypothetical protein